MFDICVFAGRMRPPTAAHLANIRAGLEASQYVFVIIGSTGEAPHFKNPFTFDEVQTMIRGSLSAAENDRVFVHGVRDRDNDLAWVRDVQKIVHEQATALSIPGEPRIALVGCNKDGSSYYLKLFRQWGSIGVEPIYNDGESMSATAMRMALYEAEDPGRVLKTWKDLFGASYLPHGTFWFLRQWVNTEHFQQMRAEALFMRDELKKFPPNPYTGQPQQHNCGDFYLQHGGAVLLVKRGQMPGEGLWAVPGGHKHAYDTFRDAALRELGEETSIFDLNEAITPDVINSYIRGEKLLDNPWRSNREVTVSVAYGALLPGSFTRPLIEGADDAREARWWNIDEITRDMMFEDHFNIVEDFSNRFRDLTI
mgnify:FL=1